MANRTGGGEPDHAVTPRVNDTFRRRHPRVSVAGNVLVVSDMPEGIVTVTGTLVDASVSGCAIRVYARLDAHREVRIRLDRQGEQVWVPGRIIWTRTRERCWIAGVRFERLTPEKQAFLLRLLAPRSRRAS
jgi:hypothetical protein